MEYDSKMQYTSQYLQTLELIDLIDLFQQAKLQLDISRNYQEKKKIRGDIQNIRMFLKCGK